jgi:hypothetical protein
LTASGSSSASGISGGAEGRACSLCSVDKLAALPSP